MKFDARRVAAESKRGEPRAGRRQNSSSNACFAKLLYTPFPAWSRRIFFHERRTPSADAAAAWRGERRGEKNESRGGSPANQGRVVGI